MAEQKQQIQSDPWAEEAKNFKVQPQRESAPASGSDDWKIWQTGGQEEPKPSLLQKFQGAFDKAAETEPFTGPGSRPGIGGAIHTFANNLGAGATQLLTPLVHPLDTAAGLVKNAGAVLSGDPMQISEAGQSMVKPFMEKPGASAVAAIPQVALALAGGGEVANAKPSGVPLVKNILDPLRPYRSPLIPENEAIARAATDVIRPNPLEYRNTVSSLTQRIPEVKKFLADTGVKPKSPLEFAKAATGAGKQATSYFHDNLIAPNVDAPAGSGTVGSVYGRLGEINDELRPIYRSRTMGEQMTKEAADHVAQLERERDNLNNVLYGELSKRSGLPVEEIRDINQRGAQLQHVGDVTDAAQATRRSGFSGYTPTGLPIPMGTMDRVMKLMSYVRGGPEAVAGRRLQKILTHVTDEPKPLPNPEELGNHRINYGLQESDAAAANSATRGKRLQKVNLAGNQQ
jgi:hypothetical protein